MNTPTPPAHPPLNDCNLLTFFVEPSAPHPMMASGAGLWLAADPSHPKLLADYMRLCADRIEAGEWTAREIPEDVARDLIAIANGERPAPVRHLSLVPEKP